MKAQYLRVKNWRKYQHYKDRRPPWIKLLRELIDGDNGRQFREELTEIEQWQLVRLWLYVSGSERVMYDKDGREIPLMANDETTLRIGIRSTKKVAIEKFTRLGFLELVSEDEVRESDCHRPRRPDEAPPASTAASTGDSTDPPKSGVVIDLPRAGAHAGAQRTEVSEVSEEPISTRAVTATSREAEETDNSPLVEIDSETLGLGIVKEML